MASPLVDQYGSQFGSETRPPAKGAGAADLREIGISGSALFDGFDLTESNVALQGQAGMDVFRAMGHDPTVAMLLKTYEMPQRSCDWFFDPADDSPEATELADFAHYQLWGTEGSQSWDEVIRQTTTGRNQFGHAVFEKVYRLDNDKYAGKVCLDKLAWRAQWSIYKWNVNTAERPDGSTTRKLESISQWAPPFYEQRDILADKLALFHRDKNGENYLGVPLLRAAYKPWWIRDRLYTIQSIGLERSYMGIPVGKLPMNFTTDMARMMDGIVKGLRTHERAGAVIREDMGFEILKNHLEGAAMQAAIDFHTHQIPLSGLAQFTLLGSGATGSFALSHDQSDLFLMMLNGDANYTAEVMNFDVMPQLIDWNFANVQASMRPKLKHGDMGHRDMDRVLRGLAALAQWGVIVPDDPLEDAIRKELGFPDRDGTVTPEYLEGLLTEIARTSVHG
jgi:hypothetical protein